MEIDINNENNYLTYLLKNRMKFAKFLGEQYISSAKSFKVEDTEILSADSVIEDYYGIENVKLEMKELEDSELIILEQTQSMHKIISKIITRFEDMFGIDMSEIVETIKEEEEFAHLISD